MKLTAQWILVALVLLSLPHFVPGISITEFTTALIVALFWGLANAIIRPVLLVLFLPITLLTLGLFSFVVNALLFWGIASFVEGFEVTGFMPAFLGALIMTATGFLVNALFRGREV
jgi:putative membrane protein